VEFPAASPYVLAVGGTTLETDTTGERFGEIGWSYSGGGQSLYEVQPPPQADFGVAGGQGSRNVPDVSYLADVSDGVSVYVTFDYPYYSYSSWYQVGGTSVGAPQWAGILALANSGRVKAGKKTVAESYTYGALDAIYGLAKSNYQKNYYDVTKGANGFCGTACVANSGYDLVTGLGSPKINSLVPALIAAP
jgi:subtilase family serine protease